MILTCAIAAMGSLIMNKEKMKRYLKIFFQSFVWLFVLLLVADIITKQLVLASGANPGTVIIDWGIVRISFVLNYNAAFGLGFANKLVSRISYLIIASLMSIAIVTFLILKRKQTNLITRLAFVLIVTGALGNLIDRLFYGPEYAVVDWIDFYWFWPFVFNIADCCIVIGTGILIGYTLLLEVKEMIKNRNEKVKDERIISNTEKERLAEYEEAEKKDV